MTFLMSEFINRLAFKDRYGPYLNMVKHILNLPGKPEAYFRELREFQSDWYKFDSGQDLAYAPPEEVPNLCGFSANAVTAGLRAILPKFLPSFVDFGHYDRNKTHQYHYWSTISHQGWRRYHGTIMFISATQGQFENKYQNRFVVDYPWRLKKYNLSYYVPRTPRVGSEDTTTVEEIALRNGIIPAIESIRKLDYSASKVDLLERHYRRLVEIIRSG